MHYEVSTFLFKKLKQFLIDDKIMFVPKEPSDIFETLRTCSRDPYMKFSVQEIGIFEKMIETLKPVGSVEENEIKATYEFIMANS